MSLPDNSTVNDKINSAIGCVVDVIMSNDTAAEKLIYLLYSHQQTGSTVKLKMSALPAQIKDEPDQLRLKQRKEQLPEFTAVCVKSEEQSSLFLSSYRKSTQEEHCGGAGSDVSLYPHGQLYSDTDKQHGNDVNCTEQTAQKKRETDGEVAAGSQGVDIEQTNPKECPFCRKKCRTKQDLLRHTRVHSGEKPYVCSICNKTFTLNFNLKVHMRIHTDGKPFSCENCGAKFTQKHRLTEHIRTHTGEKPFLCPICSRGFSRSRKLNEHLRTHSTDKPFSCTACHKSFRQKDYLKDHMRVHTGEKPFSCTECQAEFRYQSSLKYHLKIHAKETL